VSSKIDFHEIQTNVRGGIMAESILDKARRVGGKIIDAIKDVVNSIKRKRPLNPDEIPGGYPTTKKPTWVCACGAGGNTGTFCNRCGKRRDTPKQPKTDPFSLPKFPTLPLPDPKALALGLGVMMLGTAIYLTGSWIPLAAAIGLVAARPAEAGPASNQTTTDGANTSSASRPQTGDSASDGYGIFLAGNDVICGQLSVIMAAPSGSLDKWGTDYSKTVKDTGVAFKRMLGPFNTAAETQEAYLANMIPGSKHPRPLGLGTVARFKFDGQEHYIANATMFLER
jgi:hypothetical protein